MSDLLSRPSPAIPSRLDRVIRSSLAGAGILFLIHFAIWWLVARQRGIEMQEVLRGWDASWYLAIARDGYNGANGAFLPGFPLLLRGFQALTGGTGVWPGVIFSTFAFVLAFVLFHRMYRSHRGLSVAALLLLLSPASYVFHSIHTESFFLLFALVSFLAFRSEAFIIAGIAAGIASLVRHQGVFLAVALGLGALLQSPGTPWRRLRNFAWIGGVSLSIWSLSGWYHLAEGRDFFPAVAAHQQGWHLADSWQTYVKTFFLANPIQNYRIGSWLHHAFYFAMLWGAVQICRRGDFAAGLYCLLSLLIMPAQGELVDAFRFGLVLFPLYVYYGDRVWGLAKGWQFAVLLAFFALNLVVTYQYGILRWAY